MRVMRVNRTYLASPKRASITFFFFCRKRKKRNVLSMADLKPTRTRITHTTRTRHVGTMSPLTKHVADVGRSAPPLYFEASLTAPKHHHIIPP